MRDTRSSSLSTGPPALHLRDQIHGRYWLHLGQGWRFFAPENLIARLIAVLDAETQVFRVGINLDDAVALTGISAPEQRVRRTTDAGRYVLGEAVARGPAMFDTARLDRAGGIDTTDPDPVAESNSAQPPPGYRPPASTKYSALPPSDKLSQGVVPDFNHLRKAGSVSGSTSSSQVSTRLAEPDAAPRPHWHLELS